MLRVTDVHVYLGSAHVLQGVNLSLAEGQIVCVLGRNGAGKSTSLRTILGLVKPNRGGISFEGSRIDGLSPHRVCQRGIAWVPEDRRVFPSLTVEENIRVAAEAVRSGSSRARFAEAIEIFPDLLSRRAQLAGTLSGGQQQMLAIARALASGPRLLLLDEPSEGLAPSMVKAIYDAVIILRRRGISVLLVEQNLQLAMALGDVFYILARGAVVFQGSQEQLVESGAVRQYLGVEAIHA